MTSQLGEEVKNTLLLPTLWFALNSTSLVVHAMHNLKQRIQEKSTT